jgi:hypothetical protein
MVPEITILPLSEFILFFRSHKNSLVFRNVGINDLDWIIKLDINNLRCNYRYMSEKFNEFVKIKHMRDINEVCKLFASTYQLIPDIYVKIEGYY